jgi:hypothetical protein
MRFKNYKKKTRNKWRRGGGVEGGRGELKAKGLGA